MTARCVCLAVGLACLGTGTLSAEAESTPTAAERAWEQGQQAMSRGDAPGAIAWYRESLRLDPRLLPNHLSMAAAFLAQGQAEKALPHLDAYIRSRPDHAIVRVHYADLLFRLRHRDEARLQYERFLIDAQENEALGREQLVHCHSRLMEIAEAEENAYAEHLNRGIGLYLLARQRTQLSDAKNELSAEELLCRAAAELILARRAQSNEARPCWYLYEVWFTLAQRQPAERWLRLAADAAPFSYLTPAEKRGLYLACRRSTSAGRK